MQNVRAEYLHNKTLCDQGVRQLPGYPTESSFQQFVADPCERARIIAEALGNVQGYSQGYSKIGAEGSDTSLPGAPAMMVPGGLYEGLGERPPFAGDLPSFKATPTSPDQIALPTQEQALNRYGVSDPRLFQAFGVTPSTPLQRFLRGYAHLDPRSAEEQMVQRLWLQHHANQLIPPREHMVTPEEDKDAGQFGTTKGGFSQDFLDSYSPPSPNSNVMAPPFLGPYTPNAYGPGLNSDATGRPFIWMPQVPGPKFFDPFLDVKPNAYGPGIGSDQYGRPVRPACAPGWAGPC
jgi:hypothetical protein